MLFRIIFALLVATAYQVAFNPFLQAVILLAFGHWWIALGIVGVYTALCALAVIFAVRRWSYITHNYILTAPRVLSLFGNEQEGFDPPWYQEKHKRWPEWLRAFVFTYWRNKMRNLPFVMKRLHVPRGELFTVNRGPFRIRMRGWMTELEWFNGRWFIDIGPRLDQPDEWGAVSWAYRLGKY